MLLSLAKAKYQIVAKEAPNFKSDDLALLYAMIIHGEGTYDNLMSKDRDEDWEYQQEENGETDREEWAKQEDRFNMEHGNAAHYFSSPKMDKDEVWLVHFTDSDPGSILKHGFKGRDHFGIGLTTMFKADANKGNMAFAYPVANIKEMFKYGKHVVLLKVPEALIAYHHGDEEYQAVFDVREVEEMYEVGHDDDELVIWDDEGNEMGRCKANKACPSKLVDIIVSKY